MGHSAILLRVVSLFSNVKSQKTAVLSALAVDPIPNVSPDDEPPAKKSRANAPWTQAEEENCRRCEMLRKAGWNFPNSA